VAGTGLTFCLAGVDPSGATWQPWTDFLAYAAMAALPWCGRELAAACPDQLSELLQKIETYVTVRPVQLDKLLQPMSGARGEVDMASK
jgi:nuclear cap-binding protein subunit 1